MNKNFQIIVADSVDADEIWAELSLDGKLVLEIRPEAPGTPISLCCEGTWIETDLDSFTTALGSCIKRANQLAETASVPAPEQTKTVA